MTVSLFVSVERVESCRFQTIGEQRLLVVGQKVTCESRYTIVKYFYFLFLSYNKKLELIPPVEGRFKKWNLKSIFVDPKR